MVYRSSGLGLGTFFWALCVSARLVVFDWGHKALCLERVFLVLLERACFLGVLAAWYCTSHEWNIYIHVSGAMPTVVLPSFSSSLSQSRMHCFEEFRVPQRSILCLHELEIMQWLSYLLCLLPRKWGYTSRCFRR